MNTLTDKTFESIVRSSGGLFEGHTVFYNGMHGSGWIEKGYVIRKPALLYEITRQQAELIKLHFPEVDLIVGAAVCGAVVAGYVAQHLNIELAITHNKGFDTRFHRMNMPDKGRKVCLVDDLIFSGTDIRDHIRYFNDYGIELTCVSSWISRQGDAIESVPVLDLRTAPFETYSSDCPLCLKDIPVVFNGVRE